MIFRISILFLTWYNITKFSNIDRKKGNKMNVLFINSNLHGHINPTLGLVKKLIEKGNKVSYFCSESFSEQVIKMGAKWIGFSNELDRFLKEYRPTDRHPFFMLMEYMLSYDEVVLPELLDMIQKDSYDMIICDSFFGGGCFLKEIFNIPVVCSHSSFAMSQAPVPSQMLMPGFHPQLDHCYQIRNRICENYHIQQPTLEQVFVSKGDLNIVYTSRKFNHDEGVNEPDYLFVGPSIERQQDCCEMDFSVVGERKLLYISLGSINTEYVDFYKTCIMAFRDSDYYVFMSIGTKCEVSQLGSIPSNFCVQSFLPQLEILEHADVFITHAGFNSVNESLYFGVPMLALPLINDQYMVAKRLVSMQLGMQENIKELTPEILRCKLDILIMDHKTKEKCVEISKEMRECVNLDQAVSILEKYVGGWNHPDIEYVRHSEQKGV